MRITTEYFQILILNSNKILKKSEKLLKKYEYPPEGMEDALQTVMTQCELWTDYVEYD